MHGTNYHKLAIAAWLVLLAAPAFAEYQADLELENLSGEKKTDWPVIVPVYGIFGRDLAPGSINPNGFRVTDASGNELAFTLEKLPPYDQLGDDELVFVVPSLDPGQKLTVKIVNAAKDGAKPATIDVAGGPHNLIKNGTFESEADGKPAHWSAGALDKDTKRAGNAAFLFKGEKKVPAAYTAALPLHKDSFYYFGTWLKTENVSRHDLYRSRGAQILIDGFHSGFTGEIINGKTKQRDTKREAEAAKAGVRNQCATRDWYKVQFNMRGHDAWGLPDFAARAVADSAKLELVLDQQRQFFMEKGKYEGKWWLDDMVLLEQPKVTVQWAKRLEPLMKDGVFLFTQPTHQLPGDHAERDGPWAQKPFAHQALEKLDRYGLKGQRVAYLIGLYHVRPLENVEVKLAGELAGPGGAKLALTEAEYMPGLIGENASHLLRPLSAPVGFADKEGVRYFLLSFEVPRDAQAGAYKGSVEIAAGGAALQKVPLTLRVQDLEQPIIRDRYIGMIFQGEAIPWNDAGLTQYGKSGFSSVTRFGGFFKYTKLPDGKKEIDLEDLKKKLEWLKGYGITAGVCPFSDFDLGPLWDGGSLWRNTRNEELWKAQVKRVEEFVKANPELPRIVYMTWDEPIPGQPHKKGSHGGPHPSMGWIQEVAPDAPHTIDAHFFSFEPILKYYNMPNFDDPADFCGPELYKYVKGLGKTYGFAASQHHGEVARYQTGMMMVSTDAHYMHVWHLAGGRKLMDKVDDKILRSLGMVAAGEGMDDTKAHTLLTQAIAAARKAGGKDALVKEAEEYLSKVFSVWDGDHHNTSGFPYRGLATDWGYDRFFDDWQEQMLRYAAKLKDVAWIE